MPVEVLGEPTVRDDDGLALSSRNAYLSAAERQRARAIPRALSAAAAAFAQGERRAGALIEPVRAALAGADLRVDYADIADADQLFPFSSEQQVGSRALIALAAFCGTTRLIDNLVLGEDVAPRVPEQMVKSG
jgi:pantoate--beta-alanine ligase